jgi:hypothetical protein
MGPEEGGLVGGPRFLSNCPRKRRKAQRGSWRCRHHWRRGRSRRSRSRCPAGSQSRTLRPLGSSSRSCARRGPAVGVQICDICLSVTHSKFLIIFRKFQNLFLLVNSACQKATVQYFFRCRARCTISILLYVREVLQPTTNNNKLTSGSRSLSSIMAFG